MSDGALRMSELMGGMVPEVVDRKSCWRVRCMVCGVRVGEATNPGPAKSLVPWRGLLGGFPDSSAPGAARNRPPSPQTMSHRIQDRIQGQQSRPVLEVGAEVRESSQDVRPTVHDEIARTETESETQIYSTVDVWLPKDPHTKSGATRRIFSGCAVRSMTRRVEASPRISISAEDKEKGPGHTG